MNKYEKLFEVCTSDRQREVVKALIKHSNSKRIYRDASKEIGDISENGIHKHVKNLNKRLKSKEEYEQLILEGNISKGDLKPPPNFTIHKMHKMVVRDEITGEILKSVSNVSAKQDEVDRFESIKQAIEELVENVRPTTPKKAPKVYHSNLINLYITNDVHFGSLMWGEETLDRNYDIETAENMLDSAISYLVENSPSTKEAIIADLGDLLEMDDFKNATPGHGHALDVDGRYSKVLKVAMRAIVNLVEIALTKHEIVHFINISGNHDITTGHAIQAYIEAWYRNEPRVKINTSPAPQKYFLHGNTLLGFAHGDGLRMHDAGEVMAMHNESVWSDTRCRYYHFGHNHKDKVIDGRLCKAESHRNIAPLNSWASHAGFGRQAGTMKSITYCKKYGEQSRVTYNIAMGE